MGADRRGTFRVVEAQDTSESPQHAALGHDEPSITATSVLVALFIALAAAGVSYGFFDFLSTWFHLAVFAVVFLLMLLFGRRMACTD